MKKLLLITLSLCAAVWVWADTLVWEPSEFAQGYAVYVRAGTNWTLLGNTATTNFTVSSSNVAYAVEAFREVTNSSPKTILPAAPKNMMRITNTLQGASIVTGPWTNLVMSVLEVDSEAHQFFRGKLDISR